LSSLVEGSGAIAGSVDLVLFKEVARAHRCFDALLTGRASLEETAIVEGVDRSYLSRLLPLAFLPPAVVEAIVRGNQPTDLTQETDPRYRSADGIDGPKAASRIPIISTG
jgi:hypothetical protein